MVSQRQQEYLDEVERLKDVVITPGVYKMKNNNSVLVHILSVSEEENKVIIRNPKNGNERERTLHWCKKRLTK